MPAEILREAAKGGGIRSYETQDAWISRSKALQDIEDRIKIAQEDGIV